MLKTLTLNHGTINLPAFFPDGTYGVVRTVDTDDLANVNVPGLVMNGFHLLSKPGVSVLKKFKGLHAFSDWDKPVLTDSGGFQVFSLIRQNPKFGEIRKNELIFRPDAGNPAKGGNHKSGEKIILTPEKSIQFQFACGSDIMMCLDYCTSPEDSYEISKFSVDVTIDWAARCKKEYVKQIASRKIPYDKRPLLFAIIQGGSYHDLRKICADELINIGFDGFGFGGWPVAADGTLIEDILAYTASLMPDNQVKYAMGLGKPDGIIKCVKMGYNLFDCVIPTREARHNRLYVFDDYLDDFNFAYSHYYILDEKHIREDAPVAGDCDCHMCKKYSRAYLYHLYKVGDSLAYRLATIHNLRFYTRLMEKIRM
ncbi:MAG: tRNA guanosine(34) transglycosylase Tgt [Lachnospiraceae bacterium]|nr:tRNA guanosine(34) transglycosylase Tgt [Lachnospiraceae bacterium]